jgi:hypothetical protein
MVRHSRAAQAERTMVAILFFLYIRFSTRRSIYSTPLDLLLDVLTS